MTTIAAALLLPAAPAIAAHDFIGPPDVKCGHNPAGLFEIHRPFLRKVAVKAGECAPDDDEPVLTYLFG